MTGEILRWPLTWWRRRTLRTRVTVLATSVFTAALLLAGITLIFTVGKSLLNTLDSSAERTGNEVAALVQSGRLPNPVLAGSGGVSLVQVVDGDDRVVAASPGGYAAVSILEPNELVQVRAGKHLTVSGARAAAEERLRVVGVPADIGSTQRTVLVATDIGRVVESSHLLQRYLLLGGPLTLIILAALTWWVVGLALRPVAALERGAAELSASRLARFRLPLPSARDEIHSLATTLNDMLDRLDTATARQRRFVGDAAHELRSPIASLRLQLEVASRLGTKPGHQVSAAEFQQLTSDALLDVKRLTNLIDDLLTLARSDESATSLVSEPVPLDELATTVVAGYRHARVPVTYRSGEAITVLGNRDGLRRVLVNLIDNAVRYAREQVEVSVAGQDGWAVLSVVDDGPGIPESKREDVFNRFYRLDTARSRNAGGSGLGLSIVREIVTAHHGTITLHDAEPGLRVDVSLPR